MCFFGKRWLLPMFDDTSCYMQVLTFLILVNSIREQGYECICHLMVSCMFITQCIVASKEHLKRCVTFNII
jgi:hypothetical protein